MFAHTFLGHTRHDCIALFTQAHRKLHFQSRLVPQVRWAEKQCWWISSRFCFCGISRRRCRLPGVSFSPCNVSAPSWDLATCAWRRPLSIFLPSLGDSGLLMLLVSVLTPFSPGLRGSCFLFHQFSILNCFHLEDLEEFFLSDYIPFNMIICPIKWGQKISLFFLNGPMQWKTNFPN